MTKPNERFLPIDMPDVPAGTLIGDQGTVLNPDGTPRRIRMYQGYPEVWFHRFNAPSSTGKRMCFNRRYRVHTLILTAFVGPRDGRHARHLNGQRWDSRLDNLAWGTPSENMRDRNEHGWDIRRGERHGSAKLTAEKVKVVLAALAEGKSQREAGELVGVAQTTVSNMLCGKTKWLAAS